MTGPNHGLHIMNVYAPALTRDRTKFVSARRHPEARNASSRAGQTVPHTSAPACACGGTCPKCADTRAGARAGWKPGDGADAGVDAGAAPAKGGTAAMKTVSIDAVKLRGSKRDPATDVTFANNVLKPANVRLAVGKNETASAADSDTWLGGDTDIQTGTCGTATKEELNAWNGASATFKLSSKLRAFYVDTISSGSRGDSYPPYCATGTAAPLSGMATVSNSGADRTLAHELGHILINSGDHPADTKNLMHPTNTATGNELTDAQKTTIYANA